MENLRKVTSLLVMVLSVCAVMLPGPVIASIDEEQVVEGLFETYGKDDVVKIITDKRNGRVTIQKYKSFVDSYARPNLSLITAKSVLYDLNNMEMSTDQLAKQLEEMKQQREKEEAEKSRAVTEITSDAEVAPLSVQLSQKIKATRAQYDSATSSSEKRRLNKELSILQTAYKKAKENEKSKLRVYFPDEKKKNSSSHSKYDVSSCERAKAQLQEKTDPVYRHQVFFCNDRQYRKENPKSCDGYRYGKQYDLKQYKEEVIRLREQVAARCKS